MWYIIQNMRSSASTSTLVDIGNWPSQPPKWSYRIGNTTIEFQKQPLLVVVIVCALILIMYFKYSGGLNSQKYHYEHDFIHIEKNDGYNHTYPLTKPIITPSGLKYRISIIADPDTDSKVIKQLITYVACLLFFKITFYRLRVNKIYGKVTWNEATLFGMTPTTRFPLNGMIMRKSWRLLFLLVVEEWSYQILLCSTEIFTRVSII